MKGMLSSVQPHLIRCMPLQVESREAAVAFSHAIVAFDFDLMDRRMNLRLRHVAFEGSQDIFWKIMSDKLSLQIDFFGSSGETVNSIILLDCTPTAHQFNVSLYGDDECEHSISLIYRQHVRFGANGDMSRVRHDGADDKDAIFAKMIFETKHR